MDVEAALLENSPTLSTISSDCTDTTYSGPGSPYSPESPIIVTSSYKKTKDDEVTPRPTPRHPLPPRKPNFRIRPPYLMICISIVEVRPEQLFLLASIRLVRLGWVILGYSTVTGQYSLGRGSDFILGDIRCKVLLRFFDSL